MRGAAPVDPSQEIYIDMLLEDASGPTPASRTTCTLLLPAFHMIQVLILHLTRLN